jgi:hypothetical protein
MLDHLPHNGIVAELGTMAGEFARCIAHRTRPRELHLIDRSFSAFDSSCLDTPHVRRHQGQTSAVMATFPEDYFDWVYVDADHSYGGVQRDIEVSATRVKPSGLLCSTILPISTPTSGVMVCIAR